MQSLLYAEVRALLSDIRAATPGNPCLSGYKAYSQFDEDGIIEHIFDVIGGGSTFLEVGCGNGLENNTHLLVLRGWTGTWVDVADNIRAIRTKIPATPKLQLKAAFVTTDNVIELISGDIDFLSLDIDGNDLPVLKNILIAAHPKVVCVEYNAKFRPPLSIAIRYDPGHVWASDDYHGASLQALVDSLLGYKLVTCNLLGANAFFVRSDLAAPFPSYTPAQLYQPLRLHLLDMVWGHPPSYRFLANALSGPMA